MKKNSQNFNAYVLNEHVLEENKRIIYDVPQMELGISFIVTIRFIKVYNFCYMMKIIILYVS